MKLIKYLILAAIIVFATNHQVLSQAESSDSTVAISQEKTDTLSNIKYPWHNAFFIATGYGYNLGNRNEIGYNSQKFFGFGLSLNLGDNWSRDPGEGMIGYFGRIIFPIK